MQPSDRNNADNHLSKHSPQKVNKSCMPKATINQRNITSAKQRHVTKNNHPILRHQKQFALAQWRGNQEVVSFHISSANNQTKAPPQRHGMEQSTHTAALRLAQRTVANIINNRITDARGKNCGFNPWQLKCLPPSEASPSKKGLH
tara:strand:- start:638 stop:1075 length:438 start_codon:yes stop_codon:yes gene_type:complete